MAKRIDWTKEDLRKIWEYRHGFSNVGSCPKKGCTYGIRPMQKNNYGDHSNTSWVVDHIVPISKAVIV